MPDCEPVGVFDRRIADLKIVDARSRRAVLQHLNELFDAIFGSLEMSFDRTIVTVPNPAENVHPLSLLASPSAKEDALYAPGHSNMTRDLRH
jgi:hypothetical protein